MKLVVCTPWLSILAASWACLAAPLALSAFATVAATAEPLADAQWIAPPAGTRASGPVPLFRKEFTSRSKPGKATLRIVGLGDYDVHVNGSRLSDTGINQPWSQYEKTIYYRDFDITAQLRTGTNCVGVMLGNSFWHNPDPPQGRYNKDGPQREASEPFLLCARITLFEADGSTRRIGTDATWRTSDGAVVFSHVYAGEDYDSRRQQPGWKNAGFDGPRLETRSRGDTSCGSPCTSELAARENPRAVLPRFDPGAGPGRLPL